MRGLKGFTSIVLGLVWVLAGPASDAHALVPSRTECASLLLPSFYSDPSGVNWKVDLRNLCPVTRQGGLATCWASAGTTLIKPLLVRAGLMRADQQLSLDYYSAVVMRSMAKYYKTRRGEIFMDEIGPFYTTDIYGEILRSGLVFSGEFRFPRLPLLSASGKVYFSDIRNSRRIQEEFIEELNEYKRKRETAFYLEVLDHYLGNTDDVAARPLPGDFIEAHRPRLLVTHEASLRRILRENLTQTRPELVDPATIEELVRDSLDRGNPVLITVSRMKHFTRMRAGDFRPVERGFAEQEYAGEHAVSIVAHGTDPSGATWYLLQNNSGKRWGTEGAVAVSGDFLRTEVEKFVMLP
jgi:hypothetical protein